MVNKLILVGNVGKDPEIKTFDGGKKVASFTFATSEKYNGETHTEWHNVNTWGKLADIVEQYVKKGSKLYLEGKITTRKHEDKYYTSMVCNELRFLDSKGDSNSQAATPVKTEPSDYGYEPGEDNPF